MNILEKFNTALGIDRRRDLLLGNEEAYFRGDMPVEFRNPLQRKYRIELEKEPNQHVMIVGHTGSGKSTAMQAFLARAFLGYGIPFLIIDWSGSYKRLKGIVNVWSVPDELRINPFALRGMEPAKRAGVASETLMHALELTPLQTQKVRETLSSLYEKNKSPEMRDLYDALHQQSGDRNFMKMQFAHIANKLRQAASVFGYEPQELWSDYSETCNVVELEGLTDAEKKLVTYALLQRITESFTSEGRTRLYIALDDAYQALKSTYSNESPISKIIREGRKYGFGLVIATQLLGDLPQAVVANTSIKMIFSYQEQIGTRDLGQMMQLSKKEYEMLRCMPPGRCFIFDQHKANSGIRMPACVSVAGLTDEERSLLARIGRKADIKRITETASITADNAQRAALFKDVEIPPVSVYRFILALREAGTAKGAYKLLRKRGWLTSLTTLYGTKTKPSILSRAKASGYVDENCMLTDKALNILDPEAMVLRQGIRAGSEEHKRMMEKVIRHIQAQGNFAFVPSNKDAPDVVMLPVHHETKGVWDFDCLCVYECQTNAIPTELAKCVERRKAYGATLMVIVDNEEVRQQVKSVTCDITCHCVGELVPEGEKA